MSDVRALLAGREVELGDGPYLERVDARRSVWEGRLRAWLARVPRLDGRATRRFIAATNALEESARALDDDSLRTRLAGEAQRLRAEGFTDERLPAAFALIR
jgi:preprotein translocase subunit SecA